MGSVGGYAANAPQNPGIHQIEHRRLAMDDTAQHILVLGIGNILLHDDGLGVRAVERLQATCALPESVQALDGGTLGLDLLPYLRGVSDLLLLDAVQAGREPGALVRLEGDAIPEALAVKMSMHQVGLQELLAASRFLGTLPPHIVLWGLQPASLEWGEGLTPVVAAGLDGLVRAATEELRSWGTGFS